MTATKKKISKRDIPPARAPGALSVYDGAIWVGSVVVRDAAFFAFDAEDELVGQYSTQRMAVLALPRAASQIWNASNAN